MNGKPLEKHKKYEKDYKQNELYWGLGLECECYLEMSLPKFVTLDFVLNHHKRERYSVDYFTSYKDPSWISLRDQISTVFSDISQNIPLPFLLNAHFLAKTDRHFEPVTLYEKGSPPNPKFSGQTLFQLLQSESSFLRNEYETVFTFDGDTVEIMTQFFYKTTIEDVLEEFTYLRQVFIEEVQRIFNQRHILNDFGEVQWMKANHGFAVMATNPENLSIFNNGTYHINITLPTELNEKGKIKNWKLFVAQHQRFIRLVQWMEPILVANFGSSDPLHCFSDKFSAASQRNAMSRYIGLGTFCTDSMKTGKILTIDVSGAPSSWYREFHRNSGYQSLEKIGLDINFNKHWNHGVELRFFDWFPESRLKPLLRFLVHLGDEAMTTTSVSDPTKSELWNQWMVRVMKRGARAGCTFPEAQTLSKLLSVPLNSSENLFDTFASLSFQLRTKWSIQGPCGKHLLNLPKLSAIQDASPIDLEHSQPKCCCSIS